MHLLCVEHAGGKRAKTAGLCDRDRKLGRDVAVKQVLPPTNADAHEAEQQRQRALREGRIAARLSHPHAISVYDVAFALVWADGTSDVQNTNEAYALASCSACTTVAVGFQVVLVLGQANVVVPENLSAAVN